ncbi:hypothetical protein ABZ876_35370 [Streptomyces sp. NPDC046931]|uniref:hypothetical protein n=1 Tax=Streptomyces sp. NPDC046931 TaxID=3154806 RepID=UPI003403BE35
MTRLWAHPKCVLTEAKKLGDEEKQQRAAQEEQERTEQRGYARQEAALAERTARSDPDRAALARHSARLPGIERAIAQAADMFRTRVTVGWSVGDSRYASGVPLVNDHGTLLAVFDPLPLAGPCPDFLTSSWTSGCRCSSPQRNDASASRSTEPLVSDCAGCASRP